MLKFDICVCLFFCLVYLHCLFLACVVRLKQGAWGTVGFPTIIKPYDSCQRNPDVVMWCMNLWHPQERIEVCINSTWSSSSPLAAELGISANLEYVENDTYCKGTGCLLVKKTPAYYTKSLFTSTVQTPNCTQQNVIILEVTGKKNVAIR